MEVTTRIASSGGATVNGSRNWMAPELLSGGRLRKPCDIYSLGLTIFEVRAQYDNLLLCLHDTRSTQVKHPLATSITEIL